MRKAAIGFGCALLASVVTPKTANAAGAPAADGAGQGPGHATSGGGAAGDSGGNGNGNGSGGGSEDLAKKSQNPVSDMISVPVQENLDYGIGAYGRARSTLNIQPVIPIKLSESVTLVTRTIIPIMYQPEATAMTGGASGLSDINPTLFLSPTKPGAVIWGVGLATVLPTATQVSLGTGKWSAGPAAVVLIQPSPWTVGVLASNVWSFAGPDDRASVNSLSVQYFVNYNLPRSWYLVSSPILSANWKAASGDEWLVPFGGGVGKIFKLGKLPFNAQVAAYHNSIRPDTVPSATWQLRLQLALLLPR